MPASTAHVATIDSGTIPGTASLENPLYYLENTDAVVGWTLAQHSDLLLPGEVNTLEQFLALPTACRALLVRMIMRTRDLFRVEDLQYPELPGDAGALIDGLAEGGWVDPDPALTLKDLFAVFRKDRLFANFRHQLAAAGLKPGSRKTDMATALAEIFGDLTRTLSEWIPDDDLKVVTLTVGPLFERVRLMFFGNLRQDWSEFVITELGHQQYEPVAFGPDSRAFQRREDVDAYLQIHRHGADLEEGVPPEILWERLPGEASDNRWLDHRRRRLIFRIGQAAERDGQTGLALEAYRCAWNEDARIRYFRVREREGDTGAFAAELLNAHRDSATETERLLLGRIIRRIDKQHPAATTAQPAVWQRQDIALPKAEGQPVELQALAFYEDERSHCFYVENCLFNGLLGLLIWPALYAPLTGAFFHPFQAGPADLFREDFVPRRRELIDTCLKSLEDGSYRRRIEDIWQSRRGISCPLVAWPVLDESLLALAMDCIPPSHLEAVFRRLLADLRRHRSGFPDLIRFRPEERRYELIEVKGPGDRLQDHQTLWLRYFYRQGIPARVCHVSWKEAI